MPSSGKTKRLRLSQFVGTDKPKMDDFNRDNQQLETQVGGHLEDMVLHLSGEERKACQIFSEQTARHISDSTAHLTGAERADHQSFREGVTAHLGDGVVHLTAEERVQYQTLSNRLDGHLGNGTLHWTQAERQEYQGLVSRVANHQNSSDIHLAAGERQQFLNHAVFTGTYVGNGLRTRSFDLGFVPSMGFVYGVGIPAIAASSIELYQTFVNSGYFSKYGCSEGVSLSGTVVTVSHDYGTVIRNSIFGMNMENYTYIYCAFH